MVNPKKQERTRESECQTNGIASTVKCGGIFPGEIWVEQKIRDMTKTLMDSYQTEIEELKSKITKLENDRDTLNDLQQVSDTALEELQNKFELFEEKHEKTVMSLRGNLCQKDSVISQLKSTIDQLEQEKKMDNIRIVGVPEEDDEDVTAKVLDTTRKLNLTNPIEKKDLKSACRMGKHGHNKSRDILVTFNSREKRDVVYHNKRNMPRDENHPVFINEDLTLHRGKLFYQARLKKKAGRLNATWTQNGTVIVKIDADGTPCAVNNYAELKGLFTKDTTSSIECSELSDIDDDWILRESSSIEY